MEWHFSAYPTLLAYHGERFQDFSLVIEDGNRRVVGVFPAAIDPEMEARIVSHPGITYGGIVHDGALRKTCGCLTFNL